MIEEEIEWQNGRKWTNKISRSSNEQSQQTSSLNYRNSQKSPMACQPFSSSSNTSTITADVFIRRRTRRKTTELTGGGDGGGGLADSQSSSKNLANHAVKYGKKSILVIFVIILVNLVCYANCSRIDSSRDYNSNNINSFNYSASAPRTAHIYSNHFAVHVPAGEQRANEVASKHGFINTGQVRI